MIRLALRWASAALLTGCGTAAPLEPIATVAPEVAETACAAPRVAKPLGTIGEAR